MGGALLSGSSAKCGWELPPYPKTAVTCAPSVAALCAINLAFAFADNPDAIVALESLNLLLITCVVQTERVNLR